MSALAALCEYSSDSEDSNEFQGDHVKGGRIKLPVPNLRGVNVNIRTENHIDNPAFHSGRIRSFPHVRGNWATHVYIDYTKTDEILKVQESLIRDTSSIIVPFEKCDNLHVSLSRTVVLRYHWINTFVASLRDVLKECQSFELEFDSIKTYCNDDETRTFVSLEAKYCCHKYLLNVTEKIDEVLETFKLSPFYKEPSYHISVLWTHGNQKDKIFGAIKNWSSTIFSDEISLKPFFVDKINCKIGNKVYGFPLKD